MKTVSLSTSLSTLLVFALLITACKKIVTVDPPVDQLTAAAVFSSDESATAAVRGIYAEIMKSNNTIGNGALSLYAGLSADEITRTAASAAEDAFAQNAVPPNSPLIQTAFWQRGYFHIYHLNSVLENLERSAALTDSIRRVLRGEALFLRGYFYFLLTNLFGPVPLPTTTDYRVNTSLTRSDTGAVYALIKKDLSEAVNLLRGVEGGIERTRTGEAAARAFLARVLLYARDWAGAEREASLVIGSGTFALAPLSGVFLPRSTETILQWLPAQTQVFNTSEGFSFLPSSATVRPTYVLTPSLLAAFESGDGRRTAWTRAVVVSGNTFVHPFKYKVRTGTAGAAKSEYNVVLRLAELYLLRAEARTEAGNLPGALADVNLVRGRAGLPSLSLADRGAILTALERERRLEFFSEWGHRWLDLKRTGRAGPVLSPLKGAGWQDTDVLYPIPFSELQANPSLTQNPGY